MLDKFKLACVLFDLDGTLVDTAPDLIACLNTALNLHGYQAVAYATVKPYISFGAMEMIQAAKVTNDKVIQNQILTTMLEHYEHNILVHGGFFSGIDTSLDLIESLGLKWGIVTNKQQRFTQPLVKALKIEQRAACIISGDTTTKSKPHAEPMFAACEQAQVKAEECVFVGDALHDITAGNAAGMQTIAATYGYLTAEDQPEQWGANSLITTPTQINSLITNYYALNK